MILARNFFYVKKKFKKAIDVLREMAYSIDKTIKRLFNCKIK